MFPFPLPLYSDVAVPLTHGVLSCNCLLYTSDLLSPSENKIKNREYYASQYGQEKLDKLNEQILADGLTPHKTTFQTQKDVYKRQVLLLT